MRSGGEAALCDSVHEVRWRDAMNAVKSTVLLEWHATCGVGGQPGIGLELAGGFYLSSVRSGKVEVRYRKWVGR